MIYRKKSKFLATIGTVCLSSIGAQTVNAQSTENGPNVLDEIIVTATKRGDSNVQDIPLSVAVASADLIDKSGLVGLDDFLRTLPSTNFLDRGAGRNGIIIRGVTASPQTDVTVGVYVDETPLTGLGSASPGSAGNPDLKYVDMELSLIHI